MSDHSLQQQLEEVAALLVLVDTSDADSLQALDDALTAARRIPDNTPEVNTLLVRCGDLLVEVSSEGLPRAADAMTALAQLVDELRAIAGGVPAAVPARPAEPDQFELPEHVDKEIFAEFLANQKLVLEELEGHALALKQGRKSPLGEVRRQVHTLKGEAGVLGLEEVERVCHRVETYMEANPDDIADRLLQVKDWIAGALELYAQARCPRPAEQELPWLDGLTEEVVCEKPASFPGATSAAEAPVNVERAPVPETTLAAAAANHGWDDDQLVLVGEFLQESSDGLASVDQTLIEIEQNGAEPEKINRLFRVFHTIKGVSGFLELTQITELAHTTETMLDAVRSGKLEAGGGVLDLVFDATALMGDLITRVRAAVSTGQAVALHPNLPDLVARLAEATAGRVPAPAIEAAEPGERIGEILVRTGAVTPQEVKIALEASQVSGRPIGEELLSRGSVSPKSVAQALRAQGANRPTTTVMKIRDVVKVDLERVDSLVETIGELVIVESMVSHAPEVLGLPRHVRNYLGQLAKITRELQEIGMRMRMVPVRGEFQKMTRMVRDLARKAGKEIRVEVIGEGTEMDRSMVERIADPLVHLIRNAADHGIESPEGRRAHGKPAMGTIRLSALHEGGTIVIEVADDGHGIDRDAVLAKAISKGLVRSDAKMTDAEIYELIFLPGFSTAKQVTEVSGRGVGMDVVKRNIESMRGRISIHSALGKGTTFRLVLPLTLAIIDGMVVRAGVENFIIPTLNIVESLQPDRGMLKTLRGRRELVVVRGESLPLLRLDSLLEVSGAERDPTRALVVIVECLAGRVGVLVDEVVTQQQVVIKNMGHEIENSQVFSGAAILSDGRVGLIINVDELVNQSSRWDNVRGMRSQRPLARIVENERAGGLS
jgi:two-component system chemotaxis sensor kinase CheA